MCVTGLNDATMTMNEHARQWCCCWTSQYENKLRRARIKRRKKQ